MKILIVRVGAMGDVLHTLPAAAALHRARPTWQIDWVVDPRWQSLLTPEADTPGPLAASGPAASGPAASGPVVTRTHLADTRLWKSAPFSVATLRSLRNLRRALRDARYDLVLDPQGTLRSAVIGRWASRPAANFIGFSTPREPLAARLYRRTFDRRGTHIVEQNTNLLADATGIPLTPAPIEIPRTPWAEHWAETEAVHRRPLCFLTAGGGWAAKQWSSEKFGALAIALTALGYDVAVNAPRKDDPTTTAVIQHSNQTARSILCDVAGLTALLRRTDLVIGNDSGPTHLAAALAVPTLALFGPTDPARNGPFGPGAHATLRDPASPTTYKRAGTPDPGLANLSVETVLEAIQSLLATP